jgi:hypothetical protein
MVLLIVVGLAAGVINAIVGSGTLLVYPALLGLGLPPIVANGTNTTGLCVGSLSSAYGYRRELAGRMRRLALPLIGTVVAAAFGAWLVIALPERVFTAIVPWLILVAALLVAVQPRLTSWLRSRRPQAPHSTAALTASVSACGVYGGYFGAAQGVILMAILGVFYDEDLQRANGAKNLMASGANITAATVFLIAGRVDLIAAGLIAIGALFGGLLGARLGRRLPAPVMRGAVVAVGVIAAVSLLVRR